jgi:mRNA-degrading endonuclease RelE of RelBE toxin-antitoxin system
VSVKVVITKSFQAYLKPLLKKYPSLSKDLLRLEAELIQNPTLGVSLGQNVYKIRLKISSKGKGKSGGARIISLVETVIVGQIEISNRDTTVNLITIYDKADTASINDKELKELIKIFYQNK